MIFNPKTLKTRKWMNLLLISYQVPAMKYNGKIHDCRIKDLGLGPSSVTYSVILNILHIFHCKRKVVGQCLPHTFHLWICETPGLSCFRYPYMYGSDNPIFSHQTDLQPISGRWKPWRNAILRKQIHYSSCQTFIKWIIVGRKYLKMSFFLPH